MGAGLGSTPTDLPDATWTAYIRRRFELDALFANHDILMTGRIALLSLAARSGDDVMASRTTTPHHV
ncbi:hypothetical protein [Streptomyces mirabilis]|uniref:hypothetical protein n=1 Tax=Streptomyces mirabilis TaxID=68239 RepID=UPI00365F5CAD